LALYKNDRAKNDECDDYDELDECDDYDDRLLY